VSGQHGKGDESGKITGYVVDLSMTFDTDVQTFSLDPIKKQLLNIQKINHVSKVVVTHINIEVRSVKPLRLRHQKSTLLQHLKLD
jgi:hypothetical protein